jgi:hypothetical protein
MEIAPAFTGAWRGELLKNEIALPEIIFGLRVITIEKYPACYRSTSGEAGPT